MKPTLYKIHPAISSAVSHIMISDIQQDNIFDKHYTPFPPTPQNNINFYPGDPMFTRKAGQDFARSPDAIIIGPQTTRVDLSMGKHHIIVSVAFHPGGMFRLLRVPMHELMDKPFDATDLLGREITVVNDRLKECKNHWEMKTTVENYLLLKLRPHPLSPLERSLRMMLHQPPNVKSIDKAASAACLSIRQFERNSKELLGYSPKLFARLIRFSKAYRLKVNHQQQSWSAIAHACGYFDQMHLIRDFKEFTGTNPRLLTAEIKRSAIQVQDDIGL
jgi:AraC-like DNA-binding protein